MKSYFAYGMHSSFSPISRRQEKFLSPNPKKNIIIYILILSIQKQIIKFYIVEYNVISLKQEK